MMYLIQITLSKKEVFLISSLNPYFFAQYNSPVGYTEKFCHFETISLARAVVTEDRRVVIVFYGTAVHILHNVRSGKKTPSKLLRRDFDTAESPLILIMKSIQQLQTNDIFQ